MEKKAESVPEILPARVSEAARLRVLNASMAAEEAANEVKVAEAAHALKVAEAMKAQTMHKRALVEVNAEFDISTKAGDDWDLATGRVVRGK